MKNFNFFFNKGLPYMLVLFLVSVAFSCSQVKQEDAITEDDIKKMKNEHIIGLNDAVKMYHKYDKQRIKFTKDSLKKKYGEDFRDTRNVWFDIKTIKAYIQYIEDNAGDDVEGLQFYFGVNPSNAKQGKNSQSFFVAPTVKNGDIQSGFTVKNGKRIFLYEAFKEYYSKTKSTNKASFFSLMQGDDDDGYLFDGGKDSPPGGNN